MSTDIEDVYTQFSRMEGNGMIHKLIGVFEGYDSNKDFHFGYFNLDHILYYVSEDTCDGYRSCVGEIKEVSDIQIASFPTPYFVRVKKINEQFFALEEIKSGKEVLRFGTDRYDDWYPCYHFDWSPLPEESIAKFWEVPGTPSCGKISSRERQNFLTNLQEMYECLRDNTYIPTVTLQGYASALRNMADFLDEKSNE